MGGRAGHGDRWSPCSPATSLGAAPGAAPRVGVGVRSRGSGVCPGGDLGLIFLSLEGTKLFTSPLRDELLPEGRLSLKTLKMMILRDDDGWARIGGSHSGGAKGN